MKNKLVIIATTITVIIAGLFLVNSFRPPSYHPIITATATLNFPNTSAGTVSDLTMTITGCVIGDVVMVGVPNASVPAGGCFFAWISATNTATVRFVNNDLVTSYDPAEGLYKLSSIKQ